MHDVSGYCLLAVWRHNQQPAYQGAVHVSGQDHHSTTHATKVTLFGDMVHAGLDCFGGWGPEGGHRPCSSGARSRRLQVKEYGIMITLARPGECAAIS